MCSRSVSSVTPVLGHQITTLPLLEFRFDDVHTDIINFQFASFIIIETNTAIGVTFVDSSAPPSPWRIAGDSPSSPRAKTTRTPVHRGRRSSLTCDGSASARGDRTAVGGRTAKSSAGDIIYPPREIERSPGPGDR